jgi:hypothetical protein
MRIFISTALLLSTLLAGCASPDTNGTSEALACELLDEPVSIEDCECLGGTVRTDIGDGSTRCEDGETLIGYLPIGIEPVLCCL